MGPDQVAAEARFEQLFAAHYGDLMRYATRRVGTDAASDVVSSTFMIAWRRLADVPADQNRAWLYGIARRVIANELRGRERRDRLGTRAGERVDAAADDHAGPVTEQLRVRAVLGELAPRDQELLRLTEWDGLDIGEVAAAPGSRLTRLRCGSCSTGTPNYATRPRSSNTFGDRCRGSTRRPDPWTARSSRSTRTRSPPATRC
jgi:RNA polymerase sigma-70 factor (ECF subfamily)